MALAALYGKYVGSFQQMWARMMIALVPRGGGNGDAIRLEILDIMRRLVSKKNKRIPNLDLLLAVSLSQNLADAHSAKHSNQDPGILLTVLIPVPAPPPL